MRTSKKCCTVDQASVVQRGENGKLFRIRNPKKLKIKVCVVDGCLINDASKRCDFGFIVNDDTLYLVELKGTDHKKAIHQLINAAEKLDVKNFAGNRLAVIVGGANPKAAPSYLNEVAKLSKRFKKVGLALPILKNNLVEVTA